MIDESMVHASLCLTEHAERTYVGVATKKELLCAIEFDKANNPKMPFVEGKDLTEPVDIHCSESMTITPCNDWVTRVYLDFIRLQDFNTYLSLTLALIKAKAD